MTKAPQTLPRVIGFMLFAITVWVAGPVLIGSHKFEWARAAEGMLTGAFFAIAITATDHSRLPVEKRWDIVGKLIDRREVGIYSQARVPFAASITSDLEKRSCISPLARLPSASRAARLLLFCWLSAFCRR